MFKLCDLARTVITVLYMRVLIFNDIFVINLSLLHHLLLTF